MRKFVLAGLTVAAFAIAGNNTTEAAGYYGYGVSPMQAGGGFFGRLMDLERRKNAWLLRMIGR
jgi:hypothetical protein